MQREEAMGHLFRFITHKAKVLDSFGKRELLSGDAWRVIGPNPAALQTWTPRTAWRALQRTRLPLICLFVCLSFWTTSATIPSQADERERQEVRKAHRRASNSSSLTNEHGDQERGVNTLRTAEHLQNHKEPAFRATMKTWMSESWFLSQTINKCFEVQPS